MTAEELVKKFNNEKNFQKLEVDADTYANVVHFIISHASKLRFSEHVFDVNLHVGPNNGVWFKGVELILIKP